MTKFVVPVLGFAVLALAGCSNSTPVKPVTPKPVVPANSAEPPGPAKEGLKANGNVGPDGKPTGN